LGGDSGLDLLRISAADLARLSRPDALRITPKSKNLIGPAAAQLSFMAVRFWRFICQATVVGVLGKFANPVKLPQRFYLKGRH